MKLGRLMTPNDAAKLAGWRRERMLRHLLKLDAEDPFMEKSGEGSGVRYTFTLESLQRRAPGWFHDEDGESFSGRVSKLERRVDACERRDRAILSKLAG